MDEASIGCPCSGIGFYTHTHVDSTQSISKRPREVGVYHSGGSREELERGEWG